MENITDILLQVSHIHPGRTLDFDYIYDGLQKEEENGYVTSNSHPRYPLKIYKYTSSASGEKRWNIFTLISRGIVLDVQNKKVIATPFPKFFNLGEMPVPKTCMTFMATEKIDGSLGIAFSYFGEWIITTAGTFDSPQGIWATTYLNRIDHNLDVDYTYLFEIIYSGNKIVVKYDHEGLYLLSAYKPNGQEVKMYEIAKIVQENKYCFLLPKIFYFDRVTDAVKNAKGLPVNEEGYVIRYSNGVRIKIKGEQYVRMHNLISRITPLGIWKMIYTGTDMGEVRKEIPEEIKDEFDNINEILVSNYNHMLMELENLFQETVNLSNKELAFYMRDNKLHPVNKLLFHYRKIGHDLPLYGTKVDKEILKMIKPINNYLEGFCN